MNANELTQILEIGGAWEDDSGNLHNVPTGEFEQALSEAIAIIERTRIRNTATEPPRLEDGDKRGFILAWCEDVSNNCDSRWSFEPYRYVTTDTAKIFPQWTCVPEFEESK